MVYRYGYITYRYGHPGYPYGILGNDMGFDSIDTVYLPNRYGISCHSARAAAPPSTSPP